MFHYPLGVKLDFKLVYLVYYVIQKVEVLSIVYINSHGLGFKKTIK